MDKERILKRLDELGSYLSEMKDFIPKDFESYANSVKNRRVCERLLQISIESVIDVCSLLGKKMKLGAPSDEDDIFQKLKDRKMISSEMLEILKNMKGFRNILVHRYAEVDDELVFEFLKNRLKDFEKFKKEILKCFKPSK
jgi:uncharacterized protein YutE (UPF0331/DUF86 family)